MKDLLRNPLKQLSIIIVLLVGYWTIDIMMMEHSVPVEPTERMESVIPDSVERDSIQIKSLADSLLEFDSIELPPEEEIASIQQYEYKIQFWDMVLGHLASIIGSITALLTPLITVYLNKKGYFNSPEVTS